MVAQMAKSRASRRHRRPGFRGVSRGPGRIELRGQVDRFGGLSVPEVEARRSEIERRFPYYRGVPKTLRENLAFRKRILKAGYEDRKAAEELWIACSRDPLFYLNVFCWTYDPRRDPNRLPFVTYGYQDVIAMELLDAIMAGHDLVIEKSRDLGVTWLVVWAMEWLWHFRDLQSFLVVSRKEDLVDGRDNPDTLFWKIDFLHRNQPAWLLPGQRHRIQDDPERTERHLGNPDNGSVIDGESTTQDIGRAGRRTATLLDEFASFPTQAGYAALSATRDTTRCRLMVSTPRGTGNAFYDVTHSDGFRVLSVHWSAHPIKGRGLYVHEGQLRSPWYDREAKRAGSRWEIAQELDIDYLGSDYQFFDAKRLNEIEQELVRPPVEVGDLLYDLEGSRVMNPRWSRSEGGPFRLWLTLVNDGEPQRSDEYVIGADVATGTGASYSCLSVLSVRRKEKVAEFASNRISPHRFGLLAVAAAKWFSGTEGPALLAWEANGAGRLFGDAVMEAGYGNVYYRRSKEDSRSAKLTDVPGFWTNRNTKLTLIGSFRKAIQEGDLTVRSLRTIQEARQYVYVRASGSVEHRKGVSSIDPSSAGENHGDMIIADAIAWHALREHYGSGMKRDDEAPLVADSYYARRLRWLREQRERRRRREEWGAHAISAEVD